MNKTLRVNAVILGVLLAGYASSAFAQEFYSNGSQIDQWDRFPNRTFVDGDGATHTGYFQTYHFVKSSPSDTFWFQRLAVRTFDQQDLTWYYDQETRVWVGRWEDNGLYAKLDKKDRRHRISDIPVDKFPAADEIPKLGQLVQRPGRPVPADSLDMGPPPDASNYRDALNDRQNIDDTTGPPPQSETRCHARYGPRCRLFRFRR